MSESIRNSLNRLYQSAQKLEAVVESKVDAKRVDNAKAKGNPPQSDLFGQSAQAAGQSANAVNVRVLASRLDTAINKVEQILKEGRG